MAPQIVSQPPPRFDWGVFEGDYKPWEHQSSENCLVLNVWTPAVGYGRKRPVMVWCHGGGFSIGMGDGDWFDGTNLARKHDVVVVTINHRLNIFGFLYLGNLGGEKYANSGNVGMLDIVEALQWVRDNIARFGGDPGNVTIFGESGGGAKVSTLMAMPLANGLFHKAIVESGSYYLRAIEREDADRAARNVLTRLNLSPAQLARLHEVSATKLLEAMRNTNVFLKDGDLLGFIGTFAPVVDGRSLPRHPFDPDAPEVSASVPMIIGTTKDEVRGIAEPKLFSLDMAGLRDEVEKRRIADASVDRIIAAYRATRPGASPSDIFFAIATDITLRKNAILQAERKSAQRTASAYMYLFTWETPDVRYKSCHEMEIPFVFDNLEMAPGLRGMASDPRRYNLAEKMSAAWVAFARTGNPNHPGLPEWKPYDSIDRATMILNYTCETVNDPLREDRLAMKTLEARG
jgi:para-nitrobenzyl esterase